MLWLGSHRAPSKELHLRSAHADRYHHHADAWNATCFDLIMTSTGAEESRHRCIRYRPAKLRQSARFLAIPVARLDPLTHLRNALASACRAGHEGIIAAIPAAARASTDA